MHLCMLGAQRGRTQWVNCARIVHMRCTCAHLVHHVQPRTHCVPNMRHCKKTATIYTNACVVRNACNFAHPTVAGEIVTVLEWERRMCERKKRVGLSLFRQPYESLGWRLSMRDLGLRL